MGYMTNIEEQIEEMLLGLHTAFVAKVVKTDGKTATVQPLHMIKQIGEKEENQPVLADIPILQSVKKFKVVKRTCGLEEREHIELVDVKSGDVVFCLCGERDITDAKDGKFNLPTEHHSIKDAVIIGVF